jgi:hypothetical protein
MKHLRETFTEGEWKRLQVSKKLLDMNWHDLIIWSISLAVKYKTGDLKEVKTE